MMPRRRAPNLARRYAELQDLAWPDVKLNLIQGRELRFAFEVSPTPMARRYRCLLKVYASGLPDMLVLSPDLKALASGRDLPHVYPHNGIGARLCLWLPKRREWHPQMPLNETYLPWAAEWLNYFEEWLVTDEWAGGGAHPDMRPRRWAQPLKGRHAMRTTA